MFPAEIIGGVECFRPPASAYQTHNARTRFHLHPAFPPGKYVGAEAVNPVLRHLFLFHEAELARLLPPIASLGMMEFLLFQYDQWTSVDQRYKRGELDARDSARWLQLAPGLRRAIKYLLERIVLLAPAEDPKCSKDSLVDRFIEGFLVAEELTWLYLFSDHTMLLFPNETELEVHKSDAPFVYTISTNRVSDWDKRYELDTKHRTKYTREMKSILHDESEHAKHLDAAFVDELGCSYTAALKLVRLIGARSERQKSRFDTYNINRSEFLKHLATDQGVSAATVDRVVAGFEVSKKSMESEGRLLWKPKQEYRLYRRGYCKLSVRGNPSLVFGRTLAIENYIHLTSSVPFQALPNEWRGPKTLRAVQSLSNAAGKWFETLVFDHLASLGYLGVRTASRAIGLPGSSTPIPDTVGELDYVGYHPQEQVLVVAECKLVANSTEPKQFRDDMQSFVLAKRSYAVKFRKKVEWVVSQLPAVSKSLGGLVGVPVSAREVVSVMLTYHPTIASEVIQDFPVATITEFMMAYERKQQWPFDSGRHKQ